ncbi:putative quinol monooxygenase [Kordiimonas pumila]|uniref:Quinol monooxygenase n=1 Tax=Kordiimonas pumila TaxID=2161677 RepID=A0ABV7D040_9PROT|nr:antibiotic biosynthesis monooxygenase [Kordiimonas pumila]
MYGLIGKITATSGQRDALIAILVAGSDALPGCYSYIVAADAVDQDIIWVTEVWDSETSHKASLLIASVKQAIMKGRPLIAGMERVATTAPLISHTKY